MNNLMELPVDPRNPAEALAGMGIVGIVNLLEKEQREGGLVWWEDTSVVIATNRAEKELLQFIRNTANNIATGKGWLQGPAKSYGLPLMHLNGREIVGLCPFVDGDLESTKFATYSGQDTPGKIIRSLAQAVAESPWKSLSELMTAIEFGWKSLALDVRTSAYVNDRGYSADPENDKLGKLKHQHEACRPGLEFLAFLALSFFLPAAALLTREGDGMRYHLWKKPWPLTFSALAFQGKPSVLIKKTFEAKTGARSAGKGAGFTRWHYASLI